MKKAYDIEQLRLDVISLLDLDKMEIDLSTKRDLLRGVLNNFFDYLTELEVLKIICKEKLQTK